MAAGNTISGIGGQVKNGTTVLDHIKKWSATTTVDLTAFASSSTDGWKKRSEGNKDITGSFEGLLHDGEEIPVAEGDNVTLELVLNKAAGTPSKLSGPAVIKSVKIEEDIESSDPVMYVVEFEGNGAWTKAGALLAGA